MTDEKKIARAYEESSQFGRYAEYMLEEIPGMNLPILRDCFKHSASASEFLASIKSKSLGMTTNGVYERNQECADAIRTGGEA